ncbi:MAG: diguanylate cyclase [Dehalococcoidia bacterium]|nr:diguanylate cyclase [Dehalococcoidia bacterium]
MVIAALLIVAITPLVVVNLVLVWDARNEVIERKGESLRSSAIHAASTYLAVLQTIEAALGIEPTILATVIGSPPACHDLMRRRVAEHPFLSVGLVISREGRILCSSTGQAIGVDLSDRAYFRTALTRPGLVADAPVIARPRGQLLLPVARRMDGFVPTLGTSDEPAVIAAAVDLDAFLSSLRVSVLPEMNPSRTDGEIWFVDRQGRVIADFNDRNRKGSVLPFSGSLEALVAAADVVDGFGGERLLAAASPSLPGDLYIVIANRFQNLVAMANRRLLTSGFVGVMALLTGLGIAYLLVTSLILQPLARLREMALRLERGEAIEPSCSFRSVGELESLRRSFVTMAGVVLNREHRLRSQGKMLADMAYRDPLTGVANRRALDETLKAIWRDFRLRKENVSILFIDIDYFKSFNDRYGHGEGDETLRRVAKALVTLPLRTDDLVARYGGEEFVLVLPGTNLAGAMAVAERARDAIEHLAIKHADSPTGYLTISVGAATGSPEESDSHEVLLKRADASLYAAKHAGRNRISSAAA